MYVSLLFASHNECMDYATLLTAWLVRVHCYRLVLIKNTYCWMLTLYLPETLIQQGSKRRDHESSTQTAVSQCHIHLGVLPQMNVQSAQYLVKLQVN